MAAFSAMRLGGLGLVAALSAGCASAWPDSEISGLPPAQQSVPPPYSSSGGYSEVEYVSEPARPSFEFERAQRPIAGPAFREETATNIEERRTAERLADFQRARAPQRIERERLPAFEPRVSTRAVEPVMLAQATPIEGGYSAPPPVGLAGGVSTVPAMPAARPGECYALVRRPEQYRAVQKQIVARPGYERLQVRPARYETSVETVTTQEPYERLEIVPATFKNVSEQVLVQPESSRYSTTEPQYETVTERILEQPARYVWKKGRGPVEKLDHATGDILCLVEEPAKYRTVTRRVLKRAPEAREIQIPAKYATVTRRVVDQPAQVRRVRVPGQQRQVQVQRLVEPARVERVAVPPEYQNVTVRELASEAQLEWRSVLCETNMTREMIVRVQQALARAGFNPGPMDGVLGGQTMQAINAYQRANGLPVDRYLNMDTVRHLGVQL